MTELNGTPEPSAPVTKLREQWTATIRELTEAEAKAALLQAMIDFDEQRRIDHAGGGIGQSEAGAKDECLASVVGRGRQQVREATEQATNNPVYLGCAGVFTPLSRAGGSHPVDCRLPRSGC